MCALRVGKTIGKLYLNVPHELLPPLVKMMEEKGCEAFCRCLSGEEANFSVRLCELVFF